MKKEDILKLKPTKFFQRALRYRKKFGDQKFGELVAFYLTKRSGVDKKVVDKSPKKLNVNETICKELDLI
jgi:hypothetical protein